MTVALVTGATGAIGEAIASGLIARGFEVVLAARNETKARACAARLGSKARVGRVDVSSAQSIRELAERFEGPLDVLINNAAECPRNRSETEEGIERQWATNVLGYYRMIIAFRGRLAAGARIVNVASYWAGGLDLDDPEFRSRPYDNDSAYRQSKQADRMLAFGLAELLDGITINACHPGDVPSKLASDLGFGGSQTPEEGAATPIFLATDAAVADTTGAYFASSRQQDDPFVRDAAEVRRLIELCAQYG